MTRDLEEDASRAPLRAERLHAPGWRVELLAEAASTNAVAGDRARDGEPGGLVVVAERQTAGRGRLDRSWVSPPGAGLTFSVLLRPQGPMPGWTWLPLLAGLAVARAVRRVTGVEAVLKWPNDVLVGGRKTAGVLSEVPCTGAVVLGVGLNVTTRADELPVETATSLQLEGATSCDREALLGAVLAELRDVLADPEGSRDAYRALCSTIGARVRVELPSGSAEGLAQAVDDAGRLLVDGVPHDAGDVVHVRPAGEDLSP